MFIYNISVSAGDYFYSYIIIPATINHNNVYTITDVYAYKLSVCCFTHMPTDIIFHTQHIREMQEIFSTHNKRQYFIETFLIRMWAANTIMFDNGFCPVCSFYLI